MIKDRLYPILSLNRRDLYEAFADPATGEVTDQMLRRINALTDAELQGIASALSDAFCNCFFWDSLRAIFDSCSPTKISATGKSQGSLSANEEASKEVKR